MTPTREIQRDRTAGGVAVIAVAATFAALLLATSTQSSDATDGRARATLLDAAEHAEKLWLAAGLRGIALVATGFLCFRLLALVATTRPVDRRWSVLVIAGPLLLAAAVLVSQWSLTDVAEAFRDSGPPTEDRADDLLGDTTSQQIASALTLIGALIVAAGVGWTAWIAARARLTTLFLGYLGLAGAVGTFVLPLAGHGLMAGWLGGVGAVLLGMWDGGDGSAWKDATT